MKLALAFATLTLGCVAPVLSQQAGTMPVATYVPYSTTAMGVTGVVRTAPGKLFMAGHPFPLTLVKTLSGADLKNAAKVLSTEAAPDSSAAIYAVKIPSGQKLKNGNTFCGADPTTYVLLMLNGKELGMAGFSGAGVPDLTPAVIDNSTRLCGTYGYTRR